MNSIPQPGEREPRQRPIPESLRALLESLIDYAELFPPAALDMKTAVRNYARYLECEHSWMLARFVVPVARLAEFELEQASLCSPGGPPAVPRAAPPARQIGREEELGAAPFPAGQGANQAAEAAGRASREWKLSALLSPDPAIDIERIAEFNLRNAGSARIDSIETKVSGAEEIRSIAALLPAGTNCYFEISPARASELLPVIRDVGARAKIRTGGVTPEAIPDTNTVASFIANCARAGVAFKATAGLHHPLRCVKPLTYEQGAPHATMHGFLNVFIAAALVYRHPEAGSEFRASLQLNATAPVLHFTNEAVTIEIPYTAANHPERDLGPGSDRNVSPATAGIPTAHIRRARRDFAVSFGSCSFEEPISDLQELNLL